jgi:hypothetical protein
MIQALDKKTQAFEKEEKWGKQWDYGENNYTWKHVENEIKN